MELIHEILKIAEDRGVSDKQLANIADVNTSNISHWRSLEGSRPSSKVIDTLINYFGLQLQANPCYNSATAPNIKDVNASHKFDVTYLVSKHIVGPIKNNKVPSGFWPLTALSNNLNTAEKVSLNYVTDSRTTAIMRNIKLVVEPVINTDQNPEAYIQFIKTLERGALILKKEEGYPISIKFPLKNKIVTVSYGDEAYLKGLPITTYPCHELKYTPSVLSYKVDAPAENPEIKESIVKKVGNKIVFNPASMYSLELKFNDEDVSTIQQMIDTDHFMAVKLTVCFLTRDYISLDSVIGQDSIVDIDQIKGALNRNPKQVEALVSHKSQVKGTFFSNMGLYKCLDYPEGLYIKGDVGEKQEVKSIAFRLDPWDIETKKENISPLHPFRNWRAIKVWNHLLEAKHFLCSEVTLPSTPFPTILESHVDFPIIEKDVLVTPTTSTKELNPSIILPRGTSHEVTLTAPVSQKDIIDEADTKQRGQLEIDIVNHIPKEV